jgi:hypothetical protein
LTGFSITDITYKNPDPSDQPSFSALASGDFDLDGDLDLALSQFHGGQIRLMWNDGNGYFPQSQKLNVGERLVAIAAADLNEDGPPPISQRSMKTAGSSQSFYGLDPSALPRHVTSRPRDCFPRHSSLSI